MSGGSGDVVLRGKEYSFQAIQEIYHSITHKSESLERLFYDAYVVAAEDLRRVHRDIGRALESFGACGSTLVATAVYADGRVIRDNSIERLLTQLPEQECVVESVDLTYEFLLVHAQTKEAKPYSIFVGVRSTIGAIHRMDFEKASEMEREMFRSISRVTGKYKIEFIDYSIAVSLQAHLDKWFKSLSRSASPGFLTRLPKIFWFAGVAVRLAVLVLVCYLLYKFLSPNTHSIEQLLRSGLISAAAILTSGLLSTNLAVFAQRQVGKIQAHSFLSFSNADQAAKSDIDRHAKIGIGKAIFSWVIALGTGVLSTYVGKWFGL